MLKIPMLLTLAAGCLLAATVALAQSPLAAGQPEATPATAPTPVPEERVYLVKDYRYEAGATEEDPVLGQSLCGTRCNALSVDYLNYIMPGGWRMTRVAANRHLTVPLDNPFLTGSCVCVVDEYLVRVHDLYISK